MPADFALPIASGDSGTMVLFGVTYAAQIAFALYLLAATSQDPRLSARENKGRTYAIVGAILPCCLLSVFLQLILGGGFLAARARADRNERALQGELGDSFDDRPPPSRSSGADANPFD